MCLHDDNFSTDFQFERVLKAGVDRKKQNKNNNETSFMYNNLLMKLPFFAISYIKLIKNAFNGSHAIFTEYKSHIVTRGLYQYHRFSCHSSKMKTSSNS